MIMRTLEIDIETYSSVDLAKCGVYKYAEGEDFEILLFGYSVDGGPVLVVDLASGEEIPEDIRQALSDEKVIKTAHNASFERVCLSRYLNLPTGEYLPPFQWRCTMTWAAYLGFPLSLKSVGAVLGLDKQKMDEGKDLIRFFCVPCKPTKTNGGRTRNMAKDAPEKWETFIEYNKRDVEVEMQIAMKLSRFQVPQQVWEEYWISEEINDRGIKIDKELVENAIWIDGEVRRDLKAKMQTLTGLDNPNSVQQLTGWLKGEGVEISTLGKKDVKKMIEDQEGDVKEALQIRQQLAKSSVKKYEAMKNAVCSDGRIRGCFMFYGANRTGRFCLTGDHEVLTPEGWRRLDEWDGGIIACYNPSSELASFQKSEAVHFPYTGKMYTYKDARIDQCSTPDHKMWAKSRYDGEWKVMTVEEMATGRPTIPLFGYRFFRPCQNPIWLRVLIMTQADGFYTEDGILKFSFKKKRKIERCKMLLRKAEIMFSTYRCKAGVTRIEIPARAVPLWLREFKSKTFGSWLFDENPDIFFDELPYWDGYCPTPNSIQYSTCNKVNADIVQALAHLSGRTAIIRKKKASNPRWSDAYVVDIWLTPKNSHEIKSKPDISDFSGEVYCAVTPTGYFLVRRNGKVWITGNSSRLIQLQNLPQNHLPDLAEARELVRQGNLSALQLLYSDIPDTLSQLIRTAFVASPGSLLYVADFSAIEARVLSWMAGEQWRMEAFASGKDIYCESASQMFGVPVEKHGQNAELRQKGKVAELGLGYGGGIGALRSMGALEMGLDEEELAPLVQAWRSANPNIVRFWWEVDRAAKRAVYKKEKSKVGNLTFRYESGFLFITLPSGRDLAYVRPRKGENKFGEDSITYEGIGAMKKWERIETYGPKLVENCIGEGTLVLTNRGLIRIEEIMEEDKIWDGEDWVEHEGLIYQGEKKVITVNGIHMTPEHKILTEGGWKCCAESSGLNWAPVKLPCTGYFEPCPVKIEKGFVETVYDIRNCGPRHRFVVWNGEQAFIVSNCIQAISRDLLCNAMRNLRDNKICMHIHDELVIEAPASTDLNEICDIMSRTPPWAEGLLLRADGYITPWYKKE